MANEELGSRAVRVLGASHRDDAALVRLAVEFGFDFVAGITGAGGALCARFCVRAAALDHESLDDAVKGRAVVKPVTGEFLEVFHRLWRDFWPKGDGDISGGGFQNGYFLCCAHGLRV